MKPGYKQTEVGIIPEDWEVKPLGSLCRRITTGKLDANEMVSDGDYPFFTCAKESYWIDRYDFNYEALLVSGNGANVGYVHYYNGKFNAYQRTYVLSEFSAEVQFLKLFLDRNLRERIRVEVNAGNTPYITMGTLTDMQVALPPTFPEQRAIAGALSDVDALLGAQEALLAKKRDLKAAAMQQLLTGQKRLPSFTGEWQVKRLGEVGTFFKGSGVRKDDSQSGELPCVRYGEIYTRHTDCIKKFYSFISPKVAATARLLKQGDLLFAGSGETKEEIGKCVAFVDAFEAYAGGDIVILRPQSVDSLFLGFSLNTPSINRQKASRGQGDAVVHISSSSLADIAVHLPPLPEQTAIAAVLSDMDAEIAALEAQRDKTRTLKQGMMQELLTGRIRLV